eukprot:COSAG02_NODE_6812_length_3348_cov_16.189905_3_plen_173_part_00
MYARFCQVNGVYLLDDKKYSGHSLWLKEPANAGEKLMCIRVKGIQQHPDGPQWVIGAMAGGKNGPISSRYSSANRGDMPPTDGWLASGFGGGFGAMQGQQPLSLTWLDSGEGGDIVGVPLDSALSLQQWLEAVAPGHGAKLNLGCLRLVCDVQARILATNLEFCHCTGCVMK